MIILRVDDVRALPRLFKGVDRLCCHFSRICLEIAPIWAYMCLLMHICCVDQHFIVYGYTRLLFSSLGEVGVRAESSPLLVHVAYLFEVVYVNGID